MLLRDLFVLDVTRPIPPVVYFHEQSPEKLQAEVSEYIVTGGWPEDHPHFRRVPNGIHEQYVRLLRGIAEELDRPGGPELPTSWISGFYGSGKSSFAKLLGLALDGVALPDGGSLAEAWLRRDTSPRAAELRDAWRELRRKIEPIAVVFDIGSVARDNEHIHAAAVRQVQRKLGYCSTEPQVAWFELALERDGLWNRFEETAQKALGRPWAAVKDRALAEEDFSRVMSKLDPEKYTDPMSWFISRAGTPSRAGAPEEAVEAIRDMLRFRRPGATLFLVIDEVSQYVLSSPDRLDRLRAFATALGARLKGKAWLLALGQQKLDEEADNTFLVWAKDRFPPRLRVHLDPTNIRDVVHRRLLQKTPAAEAVLREMFERNRHNLKLFAYGCDHVTLEELVEVYPLLPGHIDLLLQITSALRVRSGRAQGDDQAIRGLLQLLGELFREQKLGEQPAGTLIALDQIYEVQRTALDSDVQSSMARLLGQCADDASGLLARVAKAVALLELIQDTMPTDARLVSQCLYDRVDRGSQESAVSEALEDLRRRNLLGYSEKQGYRLQSSAGEEWERDRRDIPVPRETISEAVQKALEDLMGRVERPRLQNKNFLWSALFSDGRRLADEALVAPRDEAVVQVDFRFLSREERAESAWVRRSAETAFENRLLWVCGDIDPVDHLARELARSRAMVQRFKPRRESLNPARRNLLQQEETRAEDLARKLSNEVELAWLAGRLYFRGRILEPRDHGAAFATALHAVAVRVLPELYPHFVATSIGPGELLQLIAPELAGPSPRFLPDELGILELDGARYVAACSGVVPRRVRELLETDGGLGGAALLAHFGGPPYGYDTNVVKACVAGLLRAGKLRIVPEGITEIGSYRDAGVRELFERDRVFRRADFFPAGQDDIGAQARARICRFFQERLATPVDRDDADIAEAVARSFPGQAVRLRHVLARLQRLPGPPEPDPRLILFGDALESCIGKSRWTLRAVRQVRTHLDVLRDGIDLLDRTDAELTEETVRAVRAADDVRLHHLGQLREIGALSPESEAAAVRLETHLATERPWREIAGLGADLALLRESYEAERRRLLAWQEERVEHARSALKSREGFSTLTGEQAHEALRPLSLAVTDTTAEAVAPSLRELRDLFELALHRAEEAANERLDQILSRQKLIETMDLGLRHREVTTEAEVEALVGEIRARLLERVRAGSRVRLV